MDIESNLNKRKNLLQNFEQIFTEQEFFVLFHEETWKQEVIKAFLENKNVKTIIFSWEYYVHNIAFTKTENVIHVVVEKEQEDQDEIFFMEKDITPDECVNYVEDSDWLTVVTYDDERFGYCVE